MVVANITRQKVQEAGQLIESSSFDRCSQVIPVFGPLHVSMLVLVLDVKEPESDDAEEKDGRPLDNQESFPAHQETKGNVNYRNEDIIDVLLDVYLFPTIKRNTLHAQHHPQVNHGYNREQYKRTAEKTVLEPAPLGEVSIFLHRQKVDVANVPVFQLPRVAMVVTVHACPVGIRNRTEERTDEANGIVDFPFFEKRIVPTIMLNNENADEKESVDNSKRERKPDRVLNTEAHGNP